MVAVTVSPSLPMHSDSDTITQSEILDLLSVVSLLSSDSSTAPSCDASQPPLPSQCPEPSEDQPKPRSKSKRSKSSSCKKDKSTSRVSFSEKHKKFLRKLMSRSKRRSSDDTFVFSVGRNDDSSGSLAIGTLDTATSCRSTSLGSIPEFEAIELPLPKFVKIGRRKRLSKRLKEFLTGLSKSRKAESKSRRSLDVPCRKDAKKRKSFSQRISKKISFKKRSTKECTDDCSDESSVGTVVSFSRISGTMPRPVPAVSGTVSFSKIAGTMPTTVPYITSSTLNETDEVEAEEEEAFEVSFTPAPVPVPQVPQVVSVTPKEKDEDEATGVYFTESFFSFVSFPDFAYAPQALLAPAASPLKKKKSFNYKKRSSDSVISDLSVSTPELPIDTEERAIPVAATTKSLKKHVVRRNFLRTLIILLIGFGASYLMATSHPMHVLQLKKPVALQRADSRRGSKRFLVFSDIYSNFANDVDMSDDEESEQFVRFEAEKFTRFEI